MGRVSSEDQVIADDLLVEHLRYISLQTGGQEVLEHFDFRHLPTALAHVSRPFAHLALMLVTELPRSRELTKALDWLLGAKDAAVRGARSAL